MVGSDDFFSWSMCGKTSELRLRIAKAIHGSPHLWDITNVPEQESYLSQADRVIESFTDFMPG